jgi:site-specific DNA-methyltransferase (adenine-specific)
MRHQPEKLGGNVWLFPGDCLKALRRIKKNSVDACVTDPPYHLVSIIKRFGKKNSAPAKHGKDGSFNRVAKGFMGQTWDGGDIAFRKETWTEVYRVLKPGAHVVAFCGDKNYHRLACAIEDAGFEVRGMFLWLHGQGFPKNKHSVKPAVEPICFARKPLSEKTVEANIKKWGTGGINIDDCRVEIKPDDSNHRPGENQDAGPNVEWGFGHESRRRGSLGTGRWPANVIHDGSIEVLTAFPDAPGQLYATGPQYKPKKDTPVYGDFGRRPDHQPRDRRKRKQNGVTNFQMTSGFPHDDSGSAARFFYQAKADKDDRLGFTHPTIKPVDLMQWLVRLVTPKGGWVLDLFAGTGTTAEACWREKRKTVLVEKDPEYQKMVRKRIKVMLEGRYAREVAKLVRTKPLPGDLFK